MRDSSFGAAAPMAVKEIQYWLALWRIKGVGPLFFRRILNRLGDPTKVFEQELPALVQLGFSEAACTQVKRYASGAADPVRVGVERDLEWLAQDNCHILTWDDPLYPPLLKTIHDAPPLLFVQGDPGFLQDIQVAIVGSRHPSRSGIDNATAFASHLSELGILPTSGLALGIDGAAHQAAVDKQSPTIAVTGNGLDIVYPKKHHRLTEQIVEYGAIVTEFGTGVVPRASHFPRRNRIISGLSVGVLVVEAALKSGSLITARMALEQGREVFAIPGSIHNPMAKGCHALIRDGAKLVETAEHILEEVQSLIQFQLFENSIDNGKVVAKETPMEQLPLLANTLVAERINTNSVLQKSTVEKATTSSQNPLAGDIGEKELLILNGLGDEPTSIDLLVERTCLDSKCLASVIVMLEIKGYVVAEPGGYSLSTTWKRN
ncbi:MAG: DNA-protecting protein DprA [Pseudomonadales bacterium]|nr:DNA-protecting protein DprA [Pseudomonadales bacterium]